MKNRARYLSAAENFSRLYPECDEIRVFSVGGAFEISGGWTEAQNGKILEQGLVDDVRVEHGKSLDERFREVFRYAP